MPTALISPPRQADTVVEVSPKPSARHDLTFRHKQVPQIQEAARKVAILDRLLMLVLALAVLAFVFVMSHGMEVTRAAR